MSTAPRRKKPSEVAAAEVVNLPTSTTPEEQTPPTSWTPQDLAEALAGDDIPPPEILARTDGKALLYRGRTHAFIGESESCKTWGALLAVAERLRAGEMVLWVDYEDDARGAVTRLLALGVGKAEILAGLHYLHPEEPLQTRSGAATAGNADLGRLLEANPYTLAVIDGVTEGMTTEGLDPLGTEDAAIFARRLAKRVASASSSPAVVSIDHVPKSSEQRGRYALGSQHKIAGLTGGAYVFEVRRRLSRATLEPVTAVVEVKVSKDRPGHVRALGLEAGADLRTVAVLELTSYPDGFVSGRLLPPAEDTTTPPAALLGRIAAHLELYPGVSKTTLKSEVRGKSEDIGVAVDYMVREGLATSTPRTSKGGGFALHLTEAGRDYL
jgi:hypothetical protein